MALWGGESLEQEGVAGDRDTFKARNCFTEKEITKVDK
jgi:hypothetical protein